MAEFRFGNRVALVTGAGGGLGLQHAKLLASRGARVVVNDLGGTVAGQDADGGAAHRAADEIKEAGGEAVADTRSVSTPDGAAAMVQTALDTFGRIDIVVNNAGILRDRSLTKLEPADFDAVIDVHLRGSFLVTQAAFPHLREQRYGRIVNTTSPAGLYGNFGQANYSAAKAGLIGLTRTVAVEGAKYGVSCNAVSPAALTRMTEEIMGQLFVDPDGAARLDAAKVSPVVAWLCHEQCALTGQVFGVAGGLVTKIIIAETRGFFDPDLTIETVAERVDAIQNMADLAVPGSVGDSMSLLFDHYAKP
ncbi:short-chain dehydrogenase/reductase SDR [Parafrankia sp. EAN1pec]|uniref:SDR family oxidoreductase n=1 Tax=Parafrankia sp. (strain EAN1pec) TaxID=298653 RepID=UPI0000541BE3|nr:short-chain dehydrogenase/reductase SDR [Frankia sp. EAN1pec]